MLTNEFPNELNRMKVSTWKNSEGKQDQLMTLGLVIPTFTHLLLREKTDNLNCFTFHYYI